MSLTLAEIKLLIEALGTLDMEYDRADARELAEKLRAERDARIADR